VYRTGWRTADDATRRKLADIVRAAVEQVEALAPR
jgi:hypothetical protein